MTNKQIIGEVHQIFYDETDIQISLSIAKALQKIITKVEQKSYQAGKEEAEGMCKNRMGEFAGDMVYKALNPKSKMCTPNCVYIAIDKELEKWKSINDK